MGFSVLSTFIHRAYIDHIQPIFFRAPLVSFPAHNLFYYQIYLFQVSTEERKHAVFTSVCLDNFA